MVCSGELPIAMSIRRDNFVSIVIVMGPIAEVVKMCVAEVVDSAEYAGCTGLLFPEVVSPDALSDVGRGTGPLVAYKACVVVRKVSEEITSVLHEECVKMSESLVTVISDLCFVFEYHCDEL